VVEGSEPDAPGAVSVPRTAVGDGVRESWVATGLAVAAGWVGAPVASGEGKDENEGGVVADGDALCVVAGAVCASVGNGLVELREELRLAWLAAGMSAIVPVDEAPNTAAPSAARAKIATIGTSASRLPRGESSRQLGQKPETGVNTSPQFRQRTGRRVRATAWLAAFSVRDRF